MPKKLQIIAKKNGFRRAGHSFSDTTPKILDPADLKKEHIEALKAEPQLVVTEIDVPDDKKKAKGGEETPPAGDPPAGGDGKKGK